MYLHHHLTGSTATTTTTTNNGAIANCARLRTTPARKTTVVKTAACSGTSAAAAAQHRTPTADEEVSTDLNAVASDVDLPIAMNKYGGGSGSGANNHHGGSSSAVNRRTGGGPPMDMNMYATRKTIAQGIMDLGLMCANASQLKYVLLNAGQHRYFQVTISLIVVSILLQVVVGIIFIVLGRLNINYAADRRRADMMNNASVILIFLVTVVNVLITAFGPSESFSHLYGGSGGPGGGPGGSASKLTSWTGYYGGGGEQGNTST